VLEAVEQNGLALELALLSTRLVSGMVISTVLNNGDAILFAMPVMKDCRPIALIDVMQQPLAVGLLFDRLKDDAELMNRTAHCCQDAPLESGPEVPPGASDCIERWLPCISAAEPQPTAGAAVNPAANPGILRAAVARGIRLCPGSRIQFCKEG